jgi:Uma2 family endonuclease
MSSDAQSKNLSMISYEDYCLIPNDGKRHEIIDGALFMNPAPNSYHQLIIGRIYSQFDAAIGEMSLGYVFFAPIDVRLDEFNIVQPDLVVVLNDRKPILTKQNIQGVPSLIVEILSPSNSHYDRQIKKKLYERAQVAEFWIVDPDSESIEVYRLVNQKYELQPIVGHKIPLNVMPSVAIDTTGLWKFDF